MDQKRAEGALELVRKEKDLWKYQNEKEEAKRWMEESEWRLEPEGGA